MYDLFSDFFDAFNGTDFFQAVPVHKESVRCPVCGRTYEDFRKTGRLGCGACYQTFHEPLKATLKQIHQNPVHKGKIPSRCSEGIRQKRQLEELRRQLAEAVKNEDYEAAARLHREIKTMEGGVQK